MCRKLSAIMYSCWIPGNKNAFNVNMMDMNARSTRDRRCQLKSHAMPSHSEVNSLKFVCSPRPTHSGFTTSLNEWMNKYVCGATWFISFHPSNHIFLLHLSCVGWEKNWKHTQIWWNSLFLPVRFLSFCTSDNLKKVYDFLHLLLPWTNIVVKFTHKVACRNCPGVYCPLTCI